MYKLYSLHCTLLVNETATRTTLALATSKNKYFMKGCTPSSRSELANLHYFSRCDIQLSPRVTYDVCFSQFRYCSCQARLHPFTLSFILQLKNNTQQCTWLSITFFMYIPLYLYNQTGCHCIFGSMSLRREQSVYHIFQLKRM